MQLLRLPPPRRQPRFNHLTRPQLWMKFGKDKTLLLWWQQFYTLTQFLFLIEFVYLFFSLSLSLSFSPYNFFRKKFLSFSISKNLSFSLSHAQFLYFSLSHTIYFSHTQFLFPLYFPLSHSLHRIFFLSLKKFSIFSLSTQCLSISSFLLLIFPISNPLSFYVK